MSPIAKATSVSLALRAVAADTRELKHSTLQCRTSRSLHPGADPDGGFEPLYRYTYFSSNVLFIYLSLLCFKARRHEPPTGSKRHLEDAHIIYISIGKRIFLLTCRRERYNNNSKILLISTIFPNFFEKINRFF